MMEKETCGFKTWLESIRVAFYQEQIDNILTQIAQELFERYGARVWFAEILGKRWSYRAGVEQELPAPFLQNIPITSHFGIVSEGWEKIPEEDRAVLLSFLRNYLAQEKLGTQEPSF